MEEISGLFGCPSPRRHVRRSRSLWLVPSYPSQPSFADQYNQGNYKSAIDVFEGGPGIRTVPGFSNHSTAGIFCTYPASFMTRTGQFFSEFIASTILMFCIYALQDNGNLGAGNLTPLMLFFVIFGIGACFGWETGYAINLARDFGKQRSTLFLCQGRSMV
jgi:aquaglyceroporin related protein, other eukaryote